MKHTKCGRCNWPYGELYHCCIDISDPEARRVHPIKRVTRTGPMSEQSKSSMREAAKGRWAREHADRDKQIIDTYKAGGISTVGVAAKVGCSQATVIKILKRAEVRGEVTMRKRGHTLARGAK